MEEFLILILVSFATNSLDKAESVQLEELEELPLQTFDELFVEEWWDKDEAAKEPPTTNFGQNVHHQIDGQNTQIGQIEPNSTDQLGQIEPNSTDQLRQIEPNSTDLNPPITVSDHSGQIDPNSTDQSPPLTESDRLPLQTFDELFVEGWWDNDHQIDRQNTQLGQIEPNSTDQFGQIEPNSTDQFGQIESNSNDQNPPLTVSDHSGQIDPNSTDQNPPLTESEHYDKAKNVEEQNKVSSNENIAEDKRKRKIIGKFKAIKDEFKQKGIHSKKEWTQIEDKIAKHLKVNRTKIYKWKKELGLSQRNSKKERKNLVEKFDQRKAELKRGGFKKSDKEINVTVATELDLSFATICRWKSELGQTEPNKYTHSEQKKLMKRYYEIKDKNPNNSDADIAKMLKIGSRTLVRWKKQFKRQKLHPNSVDGHSVEENSAANVQEIDKSNVGSI